MKTPHLVQYQGSKRKIASEIVKYFPENVETLYEPFCGTCSVSILAAQMNLCNQYVLNDINSSLVEMMRECVNNPEELAGSYYDIWNGQYLNGEDNVSYFYKIRDEFNKKPNPALTLFVLARIVKGAIRYNSEGQMNQSCDKRRYGTKPDIVQKNAKGISTLLKGKSLFLSDDYKNVLEQVTPNDLVYLDPPYQGTSRKDSKRDNRYISGVDFDEFVSLLEDLNARGIRYIVSYDGKTGDRQIGRDLPEHLNLTHLLIEAGISAQSTLNGKREMTYESLYLSPALANK